MSTIYEEPSNNSQPVYLRAFLGESNTLWQQTDFKDQVQDVALKRALGCWLNSTDIGIRDRQDLLYHFLKPTFSVVNQDDTLNVMRGNLVSDNSVLYRALKNLCIVYNGSPTRRYELNEKDTDYINDLLSAARYNGVMQRVYRVAKLVGEIAVRPVVKNKRLTFEYMSPDLYRLKRDDAGNITEFWLSYNEVDEKTITKDPSTGQMTYQLKRLYDVWTPTEYKVLNADLKLVESVPNVYGVIPWVILQMDDDPEIEGGGLWELCYNQLYLNKAMFLLDDNLTFSTLQFWYTTGLSDEAQKAMKTISAGGLLHMGMPTDPDMPEPSIGSVSGDSFVSEIYAFTQDYIRTTLKNRGLPQSIVSDAGGLASGTAILADRMELEDMRGEDITILRPFENDLINMALLVNATDNQGKRFNELSILIDYKEFQAFIEPKDEYDYLKQQLTDGIITMKSFLQRVTGDEFATDEEIKAFIIKNKQLLKEINYDDTSGNTDTASGVRQTEATGGEVRPIDDEVAE